MPATSVSEHPPTFSRVLEAIQAETLSHVAVIMDGNRRWAKQKNMPTKLGHQQGYQTFKTLALYCANQLKLPVLTVYAFSTENWNRVAEEVEFLFGLFKFVADNELDFLLKNNIRMSFVGLLDQLPKSVMSSCQKVMDDTKDCTGLHVQVALNYGGRAEIVQACQALAQQVEQGQLAPADITDELFAQQLQTISPLAPDFVIRTGGEMRLSNFLLWQAAYAEFYSTPTLWPDFTPELLMAALENYLGRQRRFGG
jgi:undecaprenyl diphosphate synthase